MIRAIPNSQKCSTRHRGFAVIEMIAAASILGILMMFLLPTLSRLRSAEQANERRAFALREVRNLLERLRTEEHPRLPEIPRHVSDFLPDARGEIESNPFPAKEGDLPAVRHTLILFWQEPTGERSIHLSWWRSVPPGGMP